MSSSFPPRVEIGRRVWSEGYWNHGPTDGPKINIDGNMGGTIRSNEPTYGGRGPTLYTIAWDNGQVSKHYSDKLLCIGRFENLTEFLAAIRVLGPVELTVGPQDGFRQAQLRMEYDGVADDVRVEDRKVWVDYLEEIAKQAGVEITTIKLPMQRREKRREP